MSRHLSEISESLVEVDTCWWGTLYWIRGGALGYDVRHFKDPALAKAYGTLHLEAFYWAHADALAWHVLTLDEPHESGEDFVMIRRYPGVSIEQFYPGRTDDPVEPPTRQLGLLAETVARMREEASTDRDRFLAALLEKRVRALDHRIIYDANEGEERFHLYDLDPSQDELAVWIELSRGREVL